MNWLISLSPVHHVWMTFWKIPSALLIALSVQGASAQTNVLDHPSAWLASLQQGGYVLYLRHTETKRDWADQASPTLDLSDCATQRQLSERGVSQAVQIGHAIEAMRIPIKTILSSDYCRAKDTAHHAFGRYTTDSRLNFLACEECSDLQSATYALRVRPLLSTIPPAGTNTVLVGHDDPFEAATGIYPEPMGVTYIIQPQGSEKFEVKAFINPGDWQRLNPK